MYRIGLRNEGHCSSCKYCLLDQIENELYCSHPTPDFEISMRLSVLPNYTCDNFCHFTNVDNILSMEETME